MRVVFSKDRAAQLDLLLRSLARYAPEERTAVIWAVSSADFESGYEIVLREHPGVWWRVHNEVLNFGMQLAIVLAEAAETVTFFCDDDVVCRPAYGELAPVLQTNPKVLAFSFRLAHPDGMWDWTKLPPHDHGYPGSIDGHTFRTTDLRRMLDGQAIANPLILETILAKRVREFAAERPLMACYPEQRLVGIDVNTVAEQQGRPSGREHPQSAEELNARYLAGERISLDALEIPPMGGVLVEVPFTWERAA